MMLMIRVRRTGKEGEKEMRDERCRRSGRTMIDDIAVMFC
jgi:hypothetical protein